MIVDRYGDVLVLQSLTAGSEFWKETLAHFLLEETGLSTIYERSDADVRELEGLEPNVGLLRGALPSFIFPITENNLKFNVNFASGHKTGFYLDQQNNRLRVRELAEDKDVLDGFRRALRGFYQLTESEEEGRIGPLVDGPDSAATAAYSRRLFKESVAEKP